jgi:hypothetical protein
MNIYVEKTMIVGSYRAYLNNVEYWVTPSENYVCCKRPLSQATKKHNEIMEAVQEYIENQN